MRALIRLLAARSGQLVVTATMGSALGLSRNTVARYLSLLEEIFLIKRIPAWSRNLSARAIGTPKVAMVDSGIAANLLDASIERLLQPGGPWGPLLEGFVLMELSRQLTWSDQRAELYHYRTKDKVEVDAVLENRQGGGSSESRLRLDPRSARRISVGYGTSRTGLATTSSLGWSSTPGARRFPSGRCCGRCRSVPCGRWVLVDVHRDVHAGNEV